MYVAVDYLHLPRLVYLPHARAFTVTSAPPSPLEMGYIGIWLWSMAAGLASALAAWLLLGRRRTPASDPTLGLTTAWTITALLLAAAYYTWHNWP